jgi:hypothetical protein
MTRGPGGVFKSFPGKKSGLTQRLQRFALTLLEKGLGEEAGEIISLLRRNNE